MDMVIFRIALFIADILAIGVLFNAHLRRQHQGEKGWVVDGLGGDVCGDFGARSGSVVIVTGVIR